MSLNPRPSTGEIKIKRKRGRPKSNKNLTGSQARLTKKQREKQSILATLKLSSSQQIKELPKSKQDYLKGSKELTRTISLNQQIHSKIITENSDPIKAPETLFRPSQIKEPEFLKIRRKHINIEEEVFEEKSKKLQIKKEKMLKPSRGSGGIMKHSLNIEETYQKKPLHKIKLKQQDNNIGKFSMKRPKMNVVSIDTKITHPQFKFSSRPKTPSIIKKNGELSFKSEAIPKPSQVFFKEKSPNPTFSNLPQKPIVSTPSKNQEILHSMRQPIPEKNDRENLPISTNQVSENESQKKEETEEEFDFEDFGF